MTELVKERERWNWRNLIASEYGPPDPGTRLVLHTIELYMSSKGGTCFPSQETIAARSGLSVRSVRNHLLLACGQGWIRIEVKHRSGKAWHINEYVATIPDRLMKFCTTKPWDKDPEWWRHPAKSAGSPNQRPAKSAGRKGAHPANGAEHPAISAQRPANNDITTGNLRHNTRQPLPMILPSDSSNDSYIDSSSDSSRAREDGLEKPVEAKQSHRPKTPKPGELHPLAKRANAIKLAKASGLETAIKSYHLSDIETEIVRQAMHS